MRELKMLQKEASRSSKPGIAKLKKPQKISAKCLVDAFDSVAEETSPMKSSESASFSSISVPREISSESSVLLDPELSTSSRISLHSDITPSSKITSVKSVDPGFDFLADCGFNGVDNSDISSLEAQIAVVALRKATTQILNLDAVDSQSKKLLYTLVQMAIEILETVPEENDRLTEILALKTRIVSGFFLLCVLATVAVRLFFGMGSRSSYSKPPPT